MGRVCACPRAPVVNRELSNEKPQVTDLRLMWARGELNASPRSDALTLRTSTWLLTCAFVISYCRRVLSKYTLCHPVGWQFVGNDTLTPLTTAQSIRRHRRPSSEPPAAVSILL